MRLLVNDDGFLGPMSICVTVPMGMSGHSEKEQRGSGPVESTKYLMEETPERARP